MDREIKKSPCLVNYRRMNIGKASPECLLGNNFEFFSSSCRKDCMSVMPINNKEDGRSKLYAYEL